MNFVELGFLSALVWKIVDFVKLLAVKDFRAVITQLAVWVAGFLVALVVHTSTLGQLLVINGAKVASFNFADLLLFGIALGSVSSVGYDVKQAIHKAPDAATTNA